MEPAGSLAVAPIKRTYIRSTSMHRAYHCVYIHSKEQSYNLIRLAQRERARVFHIIPNVISLSPVAVAASLLPRGPIASREEIRLMGSI